jgi:hypothetical protein
LRDFNSDREAKPFPAKPLFLHACKKPPHRPGIPLGLMWSKP